MLAFYRRHKIISTILLIVLAFILYVIISVKVSAYQEWKIVRPLEAMIAEKYSQDEFYIQHIAGTEERGELQICEMHVVVSVEMLNSPTFLENSHEIVEMISEYARQHPDQFTLNCEDGFNLSFDWEEYYTNQFSILRISNQFYYNDSAEWEQFYDDLVSMTIEPVNGLEGISVFDKLFRLDIDCYVSDYDILAEEVAKMPKLRYITAGAQGSFLTEEEKAEYASKLYKYVPFVVIYG